MQPAAYTNKFFLIQILALAIFVVFSVFIWQGHKGFNLWDEGYLWYGVQRVLLGEVPIRDFLAYDPGRYYWSAALMRLWDDNGIMGLRRAVAIFQVMGLFVGLLLIARSENKQNPLYLLLSAITLAVWMYPRHKLFDISLSILLIGVLAFLVQNPTSRRYFLTGLFVGLAAVFGRNHGMYGVAGSMGVMIWLSIKRVDSLRLIYGFAFWFTGVITGFMPIIIMALFVPGFAFAFWQDVLFLFEIKTTNLTLPIPWPWQVPFSQLPIIEALRGLLVGSFFIGIVVFGVASICWVIWQKFQGKVISPIMVSVAFMAIPYAHFAYSRADIGHLAQGIFPFLIGCHLLLTNEPAQIKWPFVLLLCSSSLFVMLPQQPGWLCLSSQACVQIKVGGNILNIDPGTASDLLLLNKLSESYAPGDENFIVTPFWPGAYAVLGRKSPIWEIYALSPYRNNHFQIKEIERIKKSNPGFIMIIDMPLDGKDELRYRNTHRITEQYIREYFEPLYEYTQNPAYQLYRKK